MKIHIWPCNFDYDENPLCGTQMRPTKCRIMLLKREKFLLKTSSCIFILLNFCIGLLTLSLSQLFKKSFRNNYAIIHLMAILILRNSFMLWNWKTIGTLTLNNRNWINLFRSFYYRLGVWCSMMESLCIWVYKITWILTKIFALLKMK